MTEEASNAGPVRAEGRRARGALHSVLAGVLLLVGLNGLRPEPPVTFKAPEGWIDLSPGAPPADLGELPEAVRSEALSGKYAAVALERPQPGGRYTQTFNAIVSPRVLRGEGDRAA